MNADTFAFEGATVSAVVPTFRRPEILADTLAWQPDSGHPPLELDLPAYFAEVLGNPA